MVVKNRFIFFTNVYSTDATPDVNYLREYKQTPLFRFFRRSFLRSWILCAHRSCLFPLFAFAPTFALAFARILAREVAALIVPPASAGG